MPASKGSYDMALGVFQRRRAEAAEKVKIVVHTNPMMLPDGVQGGRLRVLYQLPSPDDVKREPITAVRTVTSGMMT